MKLNSKFNSKYIFSSSPVKKKSQVKESKKKILILILILINSNNNNDNNKMGNEYNDSWMASGMREKREKKKDIKNRILEKEIKKS